MMQVGLRGVNKKEEVIRRIKEAAESKTRALACLFTSSMHH